MTETQRETTIVCQAMELEPPKACKEIKISRAFQRKDQRVWYQKWGVVQPESQENRKSNLPIPQYRKITVIPVKESGKCDPWIERTKMSNK